MNQLEIHELQKPTLTAIFDTIIRGSSQANDLDFGMHYCFHEALRVFHNYIIALINDDYCIFPPRNIMNSHLMVHTRNALLKYAIRVHPDTLVLLLVSTLKTLVRKDEVDFLVGLSKEVVGKSCCHSTLSLSCTNLAKNFRTFLEQFC
jgi:hypothetical protein